MRWGIPTDARRITSALALLLAAVACETSVGPEARGPLRGLQQVSVADSAGSMYAAAWTRTQFWSGSALTPWWVTVPRVP